MHTGIQVATSVSYTVPPNWTAGSDKTGASKNKNPNDPNMLTTGAYGSAFELMLDGKTGSDGTTTETLVNELTSRLQLDAKV